MDQHKASGPRKNSLYSRYSSHKVEILNSPAFMEFSSYRMLIKKVNSTFESLDQAQDFMREWNERISVTLRQILLDEGNQEFLKELFTSTDGNILESLGKFRAP